MEIVQIVGLGFVVTTLVLMIRQQRPEMAVLLSVALAILIFLLILGKLGAVLTLFEDLAAKANVDRMYLDTLLRIIGIAYITEFGSQVCRDAGESAIAGKVELAGKVLVMVMAVPIVALVLDTVVKFIP